MKWQTEDVETKSFRCMDRGKTLDSLNSFYIMVARPILYDIPFGNTLVSLECFRGPGIFPFTSKLKTDSG